MILRKSLTAMILIVAAMPIAGIAQESGRTARIGAGDIGVRQGRQQAAIRPVTRLSNRIPNRVQTRLRNRIDRSYDPKANATSPFEEAIETAGRARRPN